MTRSVRRYILSSHRPFFQVVVSFSGSRCRFLPGVSCVPTGGNEDGTKGDMDTFFSLRSHAHATHFGSLAIFIHSGICCRGRMNGFSGEELALSMPAYVFSLAPTTCVVTNCRRT